MNSILTITVIFHVSLMAIFQLVHKMLIKIYIREGKHVCYTFFKIEPGVVNF